MLLFWFVIFFNCWSSFFLQIKIMHYAGIINSLYPECKRNINFTNQLYIELGRKSSPMLRTQFRTSIWFAVHFFVLNTENADLKSTYLVINESTITIQYCSALVFQINHSKCLFFFKIFSSLYHLNIWDYHLVLKFPCTITYFFLDFCTLIRDNM